MLLRCIAILIDSNWSHQHQHQHQPSFRCTPFIPFVAALKLMTSIKVLLRIKDKVCAHRMTSRSSSLLYNSTLLAPPYPLWRPAGPQLGVMNRRMDVKGGGRRIHTGGGESGEKCKFIVSSGWLEDQCDGIFAVAMWAMSMALHHCLCWTCIGMW